jgi:hypothetical protein
MAHIQRKPCTLTRMAAARAHWIAIDPSGANLAPAAALNRLVDPHDQRTCGREGRQEEAEENAASAQTRPPGSIEHAVGGLEARRLCKTDRTPCRTDHAPTGREERPNDEERDVPPGSTGEQQGTGAQQGENISG